MTFRRPLIGAISVSLALHLGAAIWLAAGRIPPPQAISSPPLVVQLLPTSALMSQNAPAEMPASSVPKPPRPQGIKARRIATISQDQIPIAELVGAELPTPAREVATSASRPSNLDPDNARDTVLADAAPAPASYVAQLSRRLAEVKRYPYLARRNREGGAVLLHFELDRNGRLLSASIAKTSGSKALDQEVMRMVDQASPFPPFPQSMSSASETFLAPIEFSLR